MLSGIRERYHANPVRMMTTVGLGMWMAYSAYHERDIASRALNRMRASQRADEVVCEQDKLTWMTALISMIASCFFVMNTYVYFNTQVWDKTPAYLASEYAKGQQWNFVEALVRIVTGLKFGCSAS